MIDQPKNMAYDAAISCTVVGGFHQEEPMIILLVDTEVNGVRESHSMGIPADIAVMVAQSMLNGAQDLLAKAEARKNARNN